MAEVEAEAHAVPAVEEEDTGAEVAPVVRLSKVAFITGEEDEHVLIDLKGKLYRYDNDENEWKERGTGTVKLLEHKVSGKVRLLMRQSKTLKIIANHLIIATTKTQEHVGNEKACVWHATDFSDGESREEMFCIRFGSIDHRNLFGDTIDQIAESLS